MTLTELTIRLLLLFIPGIVCHSIIDLLTVHRQRRPHEVFLLSYLYGILSYALYAFIAMLVSIRIRSDGIHIPFQTIGFFDSLRDGKQPLSFLEIFLVTVLAAGIGVLLSAALNRYWFHKAALRFGITNKFGEPNVWSFTFNSRDVRWVNVRDFAHNLMYRGYVQTFSDVEDTRELLLTDVTVYNETTGRRLYDARSMYLARNKDDITIEIQFLENGG